MSLKSLSKELLDSIHKRADHDKLETLARAVYKHAVNGEAAQDAQTLSQTLDALSNQNFQSQEDYDRYVGKLDPIVLHGYKLPRRFAAWSHKITPAMARQIAGCTYTPTGHVAFWP